MLRFHTMIYIHVKNNAVMHINLLKLVDTVLEEKEGSELGQNFSLKANVLLTELKCY